MTDHDSDSPKATGASPTAPTAPGREIAPPAGSLAESAAGAGPESGPDRAPAPTGVDAKREAESVDADDGDETARIESGGPRRRSGAAKLLTVVVALCGVGGLAYAAWRADAAPSTTDASIDAELVHIAPDVGGRVVELRVRENDEVKKGDLILRIDREPYQLAADQARAGLALSQATLENRRKLIESQTSAAKIAADQTRRARANRDLAQRTVDRLRPLAEKKYIPYQQFDQALTTLRNAETSLIEAERHEASAHATINTDADAVASVASATAMLGIAERNLRKTELHAPQNGRVTGLNVLAGEILAPSQRIFTLIVTDEWLAVGNFREFDLRQVREGDCATVYSMIDRSTPLRGKVESIGFGVSDSDRINIARSLPSVEKQLNWVRVAQRFPVRVRLDDPPARLVRVGATAEIQLGMGSSCR